LGYLKIKEAANTLGMVCFCCNVKPFGWYVSAKNGIVKVPPPFSMVIERLPPLPPQSVSIKSPEGGGTWRGESAKHYWADSGRRSGY